MTPSVRLGICDMPAVGARQAQYTVWERATRRGDPALAFSCSLPGDDFSISVVLVTGHSCCVRVRGGLTTGEVYQLVSELSGVPETMFYLAASVSVFKGRHACLIFRSLVIAE